MSEEQTQQLRDEAASQFQDLADESWSELKDRTDELRVELEKYVRQNPTKSVLITFGVGMFVGLLLRR